MLESFPIALLISIMFGFLSGIGVGGGSLLILWLTLVIKMDAHAARTLNLLFFLPSAAIACLFQWHHRNLSIRKIFPSVLAGCLTAAVFAFIGNSLDISILKKLFGGLLIITGLRELFYRPKSG